MNKLPNKNDVICIRYGFEKDTWYVHAESDDVVLVGAKRWLLSGFIWMDLKELSNREAVVVGRCVRIWPFRFFKYGKMNAR